MSVVDIHCHIFSGRDIPLRGFLRNNGVPDVLARLVDRVVQGKEADEALAAIAALPTADPSNAVVDDIIARVRQNDPQLDGLIQHELEEQAKIAGLNPVDWFKVARRYVRWALLLRHDVATITEKMLDTYTKVALFTPAMMDMEKWLSDSVPVAYADQVNSVATVVKRGRGRVHPLIAFDPKRQLDGGKALALVKDAVLNKGFVGVKVYPPMGYRPIGNGDPDHQGGDATWNGAMKALFDFCLAEDVPVMAHCTPHGAQAGPGKGRNSHPRHWKRLLESGFDKLRLNLAHFGGDELTQPIPDTNQVEDWTEQIAELMEAFPHVYADPGAHSVAYEDDKESGPYVEKLKKLRDKFPALLESRLMIGTDWHTIVRNPKHKDFLERYQKLFEAAFGAAALPRLMGGNALAFLGLDKPGGKNRARLEAFYAQHQIPTPSWWVA